MEARTAQRVIVIPEGVTLSLDGMVLRAKGPLGELTQDLSHMPVQMEVIEDSLIVRATSTRKRNVATVGTAAAHVKNMVKGVTSGYTYKLQVVYSHFPMTAKVEADKHRILIENFGGEKTPRYARIEEGVKVTIHGDDIHVKGINLQAVSQSAANVENATKTKKKDLRVFLDGIYLLERSLGM